MTKSKSASPDFSVREFFQRFATEEDCLEHIMAVRFGGARFVCGSCGKESTHHKLEKRRTYVCASCGHHVNPTANTILHDTRTPLVSWFYAMYLFCTTRHGVSGKELQRQLGVTYKTAYRIGQQIRKLMGKAGSFDSLLAGHVEIDETYMGGRARGELGRPSRNSKKKTPVVAIIERGGRMAAEVTTDTTTPTLRGLVIKHVEQGATVSTDKYRAYNLLGKDGFNHGSVNHGLGEYSRTEADGTVFHVNTVEGFWRLFKASVRSTHIAISRKHMQGYLDEFTFRANHRNRVNAMFDLLVGAL